MLAREGSENTIYYLAAWALGQCDRFEHAEVALQAGLKLAREEGSIVGYARALTFRTNLCYRRGLLSEAHADAAATLEHLTPIRAPLAVAFLLDVLIECDDLQAAHEALARYQLDSELPNTILHTNVLERRGRLRLTEGRPDDALHDLLLCRQRSIEWGAFSSAFLPWRSSTALALAHLGRVEEADDLAAAEVEQAQAFGAPRALGVALRARGLIGRGPERLSLLQQAVLVFRDPARRSSTLVRSSTSAPACARQDSEPPRARSSAPGSSSPSMAPPPPSPVAHERSCAAPAGAQPWSVTADSRRSALPSCASRRWPARA